MASGKRNLPDTHMIDGFVNQGMSWPSICGEMIDNAFGVAAGDAKDAWISIDDKRVVFTDNGNGIFDLNQLFKLGGHQHDVSKTQFDIGRYGLGSKYAALALGWHVRVQTVRDGVYHSYAVDWRKARDEGPDAWPLLYEGQGRPAYRAPAPIRSGGTTITITDLHQGRRLPTIESVLVSLARSFKPALRSGRTIHVEVSGRVRDLNTPDTVGVDDRVERKGEVAGMGFTVIAGSLRDNNPSMNRVFYGFGHRIISESNKLCGEAIPPLFYCEVLLDAGWKEHLQTTKLGITKYKDELEETIRDLVGDILELTKLFHEEARLEWINADLARQTAQILRFRTKGDTHDPAPVEALSGDGKGGTKPSPTPGAKEATTARDGTAGGATPKTKPPRGIKYRKLPMPLEYAVVVVADINGVEVRLNENIEAIRSAYDTPYKIEALWPVISQGLTAYLVANPPELDALIPDYDTLLGVGIEETAEIQARLFAYLLRHQPRGKEPKPAEVAAVR